MMFKIGDKVKVLRKGIYGEVHWNPLMNKAIGKVYTVLGISGRGNVRLNTELDTAYNFVYPPKCLAKELTKDQQLVFDFMSATEGT